MATTLFLNNLATRVANRGRNDAKLNGNTTDGWNASDMTTSRGVGTVNDFVNTVAGPTSGIEITPTGTGPGLEWQSAPLAAGVTISGTITFNLWASESNMNANAAINCVIDRVDKEGAFVSQVIKTARVVELGTSSAVANFTGSPTSTSFLKGERIRVRVFADDATGVNMGNGFTVDLFFDSTTGGVSGDTFVTFNENLTFLSTNPSGSQLFFTDTAGPAVGASLEKEIWTSRGAGVVEAQRASTTGFTSPLQWTDTSGGTTIEWYTRPLQAFTLADLIRCNIRALITNGATSHGQANVEVAVVNGDGSGANVYASGGLAFITGHMSAAQEAYNVYLAGQDISVTNGQRLRVRVRLDDGAQALVTGQTGSFFYAGTSDGASGDSWMQLTQSVTEFVAAGVETRKTWPALDAVRHSNTW